MYKQKYDNRPVNTKFTGQASFSLTAEQLRNVANLGTDSSFDGQLTEFLNAAVARISRQLGKDIAPGDRTDYFSCFSKRLYLTEAPADTITLAWQEENQENTVAIPINSNRPADNTVQWVYDSSDEPSISWITDDTFPELWDRIKNPVRATYHVAGDVTNPTINNAVRSLVFLQYTERAGVENVEAGRIIARVERELRQLRDVLV